MTTMEEVIAAHAETILFLTEDQTRDVVPIMADIAREARDIIATLNEGDPA